MAKAVKPEVHAGGRKRNKETGNGVVGLETCDDEAAAASPLHLPYWT
jgi:hypothetical protein